MASSGIPREVYIFSILIIFGIFSFLYIGIGNTLYNINGENNLPQSEDSFGNNNPVLSEDTKGLFGSVKTAYVGMPDWVNWIFLVLVALLGTLITIVLIHG